MRSKALKRTVPLKASGITRRKPKPPKLCSNPLCGTEFVPSFGNKQEVCGWACALAMSPKHQREARKAIASTERREIKVRKEQLKSRADHVRETQVVFNQWVRLRDADLSCISCGRHHQGQYHAGHYRTVGANPELRFEPLNVWKQCAPCNNHKSGDIVNYRINLVLRIGAELVLWLEGPHAPKHYTIEQLKEIKAYYRARIRELKGRAA